MLSFLSSLPISVLRILDTEAKKFYDSTHQLYDAALLTRCYIQHALLISCRLIDLQGNLSGHVYTFHVVLLIFKVSRNNLSGHVFIFHVVLLILKVGRNNLSGHVYVFHVVMMCYTSTFQHKTTRPCKHDRNIRGVHRRFHTDGFTILVLLSENLEALKPTNCRIRQMKSP